MPPTASNSGSTGERLGWGEIVSYASGSVASNLSWNMVAGFLIVYYTDVALIPVALVGTLVLATRVFDAIFDPLAGIAVDHTRTRWGKTRPYLLWAPVPFAICCVLVFSVPVDWSVNAKLVYAALTFGVLGLLYSFLYVPYGALQPLLTTDKNQLLTVSGLRSMGTSVASIFVYVLALPAVAYFGGGASGYRGAAAFFGLCTVALYFVTFFNCRERVSRDSASDRSPMRQAIPRMLRNPIWRIVMIYEILIFVRLGVFASMMAFYARLVIGSMATISLLLPVMSIGILSGSVIGPAYLRRFGKRRGTVYILLFTIAVFALVPFYGTKIEGFLPILFFGAIGTGIQSVMAFTLIAESVELQEERFGFRDAGLLTSIAAFNQKVGFAIGSAGLAWILAGVGYQPNTSSPAVSSALLWTMCISPIVIALLQMLVISFYRYDGVPIGKSRPISQRQESPLP